MKTRLDLLLDGVEAGKREITFDVRDFTKEHVQAVIEAAQKRGFHAAYDGSFILVRDLRQPGENNAKNQISGI